MTDDTGTPLASSRDDRNGRGLEGFSVGNAIRLPAAGVLAHGLDDGVEAKQRFDFLASEVARLMPLWPRDLEATTAMKRARLLVKIRRALMADFERGESGHWDYDYARHCGLRSNFIKMREACKSC